MWSSDGKKRPRAREVMMTMGMRIRRSLMVKIDLDFGVSASILFISVVR